MICACCQPILKIERPSARSADARGDWVRPRLPEIEAIVIENQEMDPQGGGKPAITAMGAVIANAVYDAVGARCYTLPMTPERVLSAMG